MHVQVRITRCRSKEAGEGGRAFAKCSLMFSWQACSFNVLSCSSYANEIQTLCLTRSQSDSAIHCVVVRYVAQGLDRSPSTNKVKQDETGFGEDKH